MSDERMRIQKYLSSLNLLSRRETEAYILKGWIQVNGKVVTELGTKIDPNVDEVTLMPEGQAALKSYTYIAFFKPVGIVSNCPVEGERQITDILPPEFSHLSTIGRLDKDSEGLILLTDDGLFAKAALGSAHEREYLVRVNGNFTPSMAERLEEGVYILGAETRPVRIKRLDDQCFLMEMTEGKNRQIRRMIQKVGLHVVRLKRLRFGNVRLGDLQKGEYRPLTKFEKAGFSAGDG